MSAIDADRLVRILGAVADDRTFTEIADVEGISRQRVQQIVKEHSSPALGGMAARALRMTEFGLTAEQIAEVEDVKERTIRETFQRERGILWRREKTIREEAERDLLAKLYEGGLSQQELTDALGLGSQSAFGKRLRKTEAAMRPRFGRKETK